MALAVVAGFFAKLVEAIPAIYAATLSILEESGFHPSDQYWTALLKKYQDAGWLNADDVLAIEKTRAREFPGNWVEKVFFVMTMMTGRISLSMAAMTGTMLQELNKKYSPSPPDPYTLIRGGFIAPELGDQFRDAMKRSGLGDKDIDLNIISNYALYDILTIRTLFLRKELSEEEAFIRLREHGFTDTRIREMVLAWPVIPSASEIFWMAGKEAFEPEEVAKGQLLDELPEDLLVWLEKQGLSRYWGERWWIAHWDPPSIGQGCEMSQRDVIDRSDLDYLFKTVEVPPIWRDRLLAIAYNPLTRVDIRRMHKTGTLDETAVFDALRHVGFSPENAQLMTEFYINYNQEGERDLTRTQIMKGYRDLGISSEDTKDLLVGIGFTDAQADFFIGLEDASELQDEISEEIALIREKYQGNLIPRSEVQASLSRLEIPGTKVNHLLRKWDTYKMLDVKLPSKADLLKFRVAGAIDEDRHRQELRKLGYNSEYADWYIKLYRK